MKNSLVCFTLLSALSGVICANAEELPPLPEVGELPDGLEQQPEAAVSDGTFEAPPVVQASSVLSPALLAGPHFRVRDQVISDGFLYHFVIDSDFGVFQCAGIEDVVMTIGEIAAIAKLVEVSKSDLFADALKKSISQPIDAVKNIAHDPVGAVRQVPNTVGHFFNKVGSSLGNASKKIGAQMGDSSGADTAVAMGVGISEGAKSIAGFSKAKLDCARQLGVDPYSDNARLQEEMEKVAWVFFAGGMPLRVGAMVASGGASMALTATNTVGLPEELYDLTPSELELRDRETMTSIGAEAALIDQVFLNPVLSLSRRHAMITAISSLPGGKSRVALIELVRSLENAQQADFLVRVFQHLSARNAKTMYADCALIGRLPAGVTKDGIVEVVAPVDHVSWTPQVAGFAQREDLSSRPRRVVLLGSISEIATQGFREAGWQMGK